MSTPNSPQEYSCPPWCEGHLGADTRHLPDLMHATLSVGYDGLVKRDGWDPILFWQLGSYSRADGMPGKPFVMMGPDYEMIYDVDAVHDVINTLERALPKLREWSKALETYEEP